MKNSFILKKRNRIINGKECLFELKDALPQIFQAYHEAIKLYNIEIALTPPTARIRGFESQVLNAKIIQCIQKEFPENWRRGKYSRIMLSINGYIIFFKKLNKYGMPMNIKTTFNDNITNQCQVSLFDSDDVTSPILFFGYSKNNFGEITNPRIVYIDEDKVKFEIHESDIKRKTKIETIHTLKPVSHVKLKTRDKRTGTID